MKFYSGILDRKKLLEKNQLLIKNYEFFFYSPCTVIYDLYFRIFYDSSKKSNFTIFSMKNKPKIKQQQQQIDICEISIDEADWFV